MKQYIVDAFTREPFKGNPAAVCVPDAWPDESRMRLLAAENNLSETAFLVPERDGFRLRWFTPGTEVDLCGHATLASAFVVMNHLTPGVGGVRFFTRSGVLTVRRSGSFYEMDLPAGENREIPVTDAMERAYGLRPVRALLGTDLVCVFETEEQVSGLEPDPALLRELDGRIQNATARGTSHDCVSRSFCPKLSIPEDPVCGSAHCQIAAFWAEELGKNVIDAYQASRRGGVLRCAMKANGRITIAGEAALVAVTEIVADLRA